MVLDWFRRRAPGEADGNVVHLTDEQELLVTTIARLHDEKVAIRAGLVLLRERIDALITLIDHRHTVSAAPPITQVVTERSIPYASPFDEVRYPTQSGRWDVTYPTHDAQDEEG